MAPTRSRGRRLAALAAALLLAACTPAPRGASAKAPPRRRLELREGPTRVTLEERGLAEPGRATAADLAEGAREWHADTGARRFGGPVLGYVTPWWAGARGGGGGGGKQMLRH
jgi:hypothetical protein